MTGLESILKGIEDEARTLADEILKNAQKEADEIVSRAKQTATNEAMKISDETDREIKFLEEKNRSMAELQGKRIVLKGKNEAIDFIIEATKNEILNMDDAEYFDLIFKLVDKFLESKPATIIFSDKDLKRMTYEFRNELLSLAEKNGSQLTISQKGAKISGGFIINYGDIEENCSVDALFESFYDDISDKVNATVF